MKKLLILKAWPLYYTGSHKDLLVKAALLAPPENPSQLFHLKYVATETTLFMACYLDEH